MAFISPDMYRGELKKGEDFLNEADSFMSKNRPILVQAEVQEKIEEGNRLLGRMEVYLESLNKSKNDNYIDMAKRISDKIDELKEYDNGFVK